MTSYKIAESGRNFGIASCQLFNIRSLVVTFCTITIGLAALRAKNKLSRHKKLYCKIESTRIMVRNMNRCVIRHFSKPCADLITNLTLAFAHGPYLIYIHIFSDS
jgi:uncharacterized membrane-anchored protein YhcB (DUF1043 family)